ncbi:MAG TPA: hypothetical protein VMC44_00570 [Geobacteraceae bacterium]|nr:hypothetical protein [Geobacteraceae bacterium]
MSNFPGKMTPPVVALLVFTFLFSPAWISAAPVPKDGPVTGGGEAPAAAEPLLLGGKIDKAITVGETHSYIIYLKAGQSADVLIEKQGVALTATVFAPDGRRIGRFGSIASGRGTQEVRILADSPGQYRIALHTMLKPDPPGRYLLRLEAVHAATDKELAGAALQSCEEKPWRDRDDNFLVNEALGAISRCLEAVSQRLEKVSPQTAKTAAQVKGDLDYLIGRWHWGEFVSDAYRESLVGDFRMLAAAAGEPDGERAAAIVKGVAEDLKIKADNCRSSNRGLGDDVDVFVRTIRENRKVDGLYVYYKLGIYAYKKESMPPTSFDRLSSPAHKKLPASWYLIWAGKPGEPEPPLNRLRRIEVEKEKAREGYDLLIP